MRNEGAIRDRAIRLFRFLHELKLLESRPVYRTDSYENVLWLHNIPRADGCWCVGRPGAGDGALVEVRKPVLKDAPAPPVELASLLDARVGFADPGSIPRLVDAGAEGVVAGLLELLEEYLAGLWEPWARQDRIDRAVQDAFTELFSMYQRIDTQGDQLELVLGVGHLAWRTPSGHPVLRHILAAPVALVFEAERGVMRVLPKGERWLGLEQDMLEAGERPAAKVRNDIEQAIEGMEPGAWNEERLRGLVMSWTNALAPDSRFEPRDEPRTTADETPVVTWAPALMLRRRNQGATILFLKEIVDQLEAGGAVPEPIAQIVGADSDDRAVDVKVEPLLPLPANDEQRDLVRQVTARTGMVVQGPPGTGKSHTIANLIAHLLASGMRVLVTSHTAKALRVLREKLPPEIAKLCVPLLGRDTEDQLALQATLNGLHARAGTETDAQAAERASRFERELKEARQEEQRLFREVRRVRENEIYTYPGIGEYSGSCQSIAQLVRARASRHSWLTVRPAADEAAPLGSAEVEELLGLLDAHANVAASGFVGDCGALDKLPGVDDFRALTENEAAARARFEASAVARGHESYVAIKGLSGEQRDLLAESAAAVEKKLARPTAAPEAWSKAALADILSGREHAWLDLAAVSREVLTAVRERVGSAGEPEVSGVEGRDLATLVAHASDLLSHLRKGHGLGFGLLRPRPVKDADYLLTEVRVEGRACNTVETLEKLLAWADTRKRLGRLGRAWADLGVEVKATTAQVQIRQFESAERDLAALLELHAELERLRRQLAEAGCPDARLGGQDDFKAIDAACAAAKAEEALRDAEDRTGKVVMEYASGVPAGQVHPLCRAAAEALEQRNVEGYREARDGLLAAAALQDTVARRDTLVAKLSARLPELAGELLSAPGGDKLQERLRGLGQSWEWAKAVAWLEGKMGAGSDGDRTAELDVAERRTRELVADLASTQAWRYCLRRLSPELRSALEAWRQVQQRLGRRKGKYVQKWEEESRNCMQQCTGAIPAWIMPAHRVCETIRPQPGAFDVVVVDEASQSSSEALLLCYLARKVVIVGDDKQISPTSFVYQGAVEELRVRFIPDLPFGKLLGATGSLFDAAQVRFRDRVRLREHFRAMPEIIEFSNRLCYADEPLIPVRQYGTKRLAPLRSIHVPEGRVEGKGDKQVNRQEAEALVGAVKQCLASSDYAGRTMGVISLLAREQAVLIERMLLRDTAVGPQEMERRRLVCGDAHSFQGDERDVIFLSMVAAPSERGPLSVLNQQTHVQRFNVAVSRARDQCWLVHSATLTDIVNPDCVRHKLLEYFTGPAGEQPSPDGVTGKLLARIQAVERAPGVTPPEPFESWFEVDVFLPMAERGYRVVPQFRAHGYSIDMVVEGAASKLAIECDGDYWHGPERYEADLRRQRALERCGWRFWRVRGSVFYQEPDKAMASLWRTIEKLGIEPGAVGA